MYLMLANYMGNIHFMFLIDLSKWMTENVALICQGFAFYFRDKNFALIQEPSNSIKVLHLPKGCD
jgi:hypothetical protein